MKVRQLSLHTVINPGGTYYFYNTETNKLTNLGMVSPWLNEDHMAEMTPISYTSRDGLTINGYLTIPKGSNGKIYLL